MGVAEGGVGGGSLFRKRPEKGGPGGATYPPPPPWMGVSGTAVGTRNIAVLENKVHF